MAEQTLSNDNLKALIEAILYVSPEPVTLEMLAKALTGEPRDRIKASLFELMNDYAWPQHGIQIRPVAGGWKFSSKAEHHEVLRDFVKSLKPAIRLSKPALEVLAVIAYRQPVTVPEINEIRGVDCGGVIHTLLERKLIVTAGRKNVVGRPILYRTSREFLVHFGLRDLSEMPSLREFEEMARQALGSELLPPDEFASEAGSEGAATPGDKEDPSPNASGEQAIVSLDSANHKPSETADGSEAQPNTGAPAGSALEDRGLSVAADDSQPGEGDAALPSRQEGRGDAKTS